MTNLVCGSLSHRCGRSSQGRGYQQPGAQGVSRRTPALSATPSLWPPQSRRRPLSPLALSSVLLGFRRKAAASKWVARKWPIGSIATNSHRHTLFADGSPMAEHRCGRYGAGPIFPRRFEVTPPCRRPQVPIFPTERNVDLRKPSRRRRPARREHIQSQSGAKFRPPPSAGIPKEDPSLRKRCGTASRPAQRTCAGARGVLNCFPPQFFCRPGMDARSPRAIAPLQMPDREPCRKEALLVAVPHARANPLLTAPTKPPRTGMGRH